MYELPNGFIVNLFYVVMISPITGTGDKFHVYLDGGNTIDVYATCAKRKHAQRRDMTQEQLLEMEHESLVKAFKKSVGLKYSSHTKNARLGGCGWPIGSGQI